MTSNPKNMSKDPNLSWDDQSKTLSAETLDAKTRAMDRTLQKSSAAAAGVPVTGGTVRVTVLPRVKPGEGKPVIDHQALTRYEEHDLLGTGGMGEVVAAVDNDIGRPVAVKRLLKDMQGDENLVRFAAEIRTIGSLEHPNIVPVHDVGVDENGRHYFVMKYVQGETIESIIEKLQKGDPVALRLYTFEERTRIFMGILEAVRYAHSRGVIHRDIKPANVMVGPYGEVILTDWGIAKKIRDASGQEAAKGSAVVDAIAAGVMPSCAPDSSVMETAAGALVGTPAYMSPEQALCLPPDEKSDIYSLCVLFYEFLCLRHPLSGRKTLEAILHGVREFTPSHPVFLSHPRQGRVPADLGWFVMRGLKKDPSGRYRSVDEMIQRLKRRSAGMVPVQCPITFMKRLTGGVNRFIDRHPIITVGGVSLAALGAVGLLALGRWRLVLALM